MPLKFLLKEYLDGQGVSQNALAKRTGLKRQWINNICNQQPPRISLATLEKLCAELGCQPADLLVMEGESKRMQACKKNSPPG